MKWSLVMHALVFGRNGNRHRRSQSSPLNLPVDIPEGSSGDEVGSPATQARNHDRLIQDVSSLHHMPAYIMSYLVFIPWLSRM